MPLFNWHLKNVFHYLLEKHIFVLFLAATFTRE